jgi:hypothetical protein
VSSDPAYGAEKRWRAQMCQTHHSHTMCRFAGTLAGRARYRIGSIEFNFTVVDAVGMTCGCFGARVDTETFPNSVWADRRSVKPYPQGRRSKLWLGGAVAISANPSCMRCSLRAALSFSLYLSLCAWVHKRWTRWAGDRPMCEFRLQRRPRWVGAALEDPGPPARRVRS